METLVDEKRFAYSYKNINNNYSMENNFDSRQNCNELLGPCSKTVTDLQKYYNRLIIKSFISNSPFSSG